MRPPTPPGLDRLVGAEAAANWELVVLFPAASAVLLCVFRYETGIPIKVGVLVIPPLTAVGVGIAFWIHAGVGVAVLQALGILCAALIPVLVAFDVIVGGRRSPVRPGPPSRRG
jgi:hypothetical protein